MKRKLSLFLAIALLAAIALPAITPVVNAAGVDTIYVSKTGVDTNAGTEAEPVRTLNQAYKLLYAAKGNGAGTVDTNIIMVMDELGKDGTLAPASGPNYLSGTGVWTARVNATIRGANDTASITPVISSTNYVIFAGSTVFDNIDINSVAYFEYGCQIGFFRSLTVTDTVTTSGNPISISFSKLDGAVAINGGEWDNIFAVTDNSTTTLTIGGNATVNNLYASGSAVRNSGTISVSKVITLNVAGGSVDNLYVGGRTREKYSSYVHSNVLSTVNVNVSSGKVTNLYMGGIQKAATSGAINVTNATIKQTGGVIENVNGGVSPDDATAANTIGTLNATFLDTNAINFEISSMPTTAMNLNFGKTTVNFDADDLAAIKASGATETTLTLGKAAATTDGYEDAYSVAMSGITATADVTLTLDAYIKEANVLNNGTTVAMGADKKVAFTNATLGLFEIDIIAATAATIGEAEYPSFEAALAAAASGDTIKLMADVDLSGETIVLNPGVQLYLGKFDLTAERVIGLDGAAIGGTAMEGKLNVAKNMLKLDAPYTYDNGEQSVPVWNGDHYTFSKISFAIDADALQDYEGTLKYSFAANAFDAVEALLAQENGATNCGLAIQVKLTWVQNGTEFNLICDYEDAFIQNVAASNTVDFTLSLPGYAQLGFDLDGLTITPMVVSDTGAAVAAK